jgi:anthranilate/para-aminobenzoate synthase component II
MILIVSTCKEKLNEYEFVTPIIQIVKKFDKVKIVKFNELDKTKELVGVNKIIITGTALKDFEYLKYVKNFSFLLHTEAPILGICAGAQIIGKFFGCRLSEKFSIGRYRVKIISQTPLCQQKKFFAYFLFSRYVVLNKEFESLGVKGNSVVFFKHKQLPIYATLFHPEVYNPDVIVNFLSRS